MKKTTEQSVKVEMSREQAMKMLSSQVPNNAKNVTLTEKAGRFMLTYKTLAVEGGEDPGIKQAEDLLSSVKEPAKDPAKK